MKNLIIIGAGGLGKEVAWLVEGINEINPTWNLLGFIDDNPQIQGQEILGYKVLGTSECVGQYGDSYFVCAVGFAKIRKRIVEKIGDVKYATLIDPSAVVSKHTSIGEGSIICAKAVVTVDITIGKHTIVNPAATIGHDAKIGDFVTLYPASNVCGSTDIGDCVELGVGCQVIQGKTVGKNSIIGAGAVVIRDIPDNCTAVGCPANPIKFFEA